MKPKRTLPTPKALLRTLTAAAVAMGGLAAATAASNPDTYPTRTITNVVPYPPGGIVDNVARNLGVPLSAALGQTIIVDNRPSAGGTVGTSQVARAEPDGYTLLTVFDTHAVNPMLNKQLPYDNDKDLAPIALIATSPLVLAVHPSVPANTVAELVALAKEKPGQLNYASTGIGSSNHLVTELFKSIAGVDLYHVPYKGGAPAITGLVGGRVQVMFVSATSVLGHIQAGRMRPLAVTTREPVPQLPGVPSISETYPEFEARSWVGLLTRAGTPEPILEKLNAEVNQALQTPEMQRFLQAQALQAGGGTREEFAEFMRAESNKWGKVIEEAKISIE